MKTATLFALTFLAIMMFVSESSSQSDINGTWKLSGYQFIDKTAYPTETMKIEVNIADGSIGGKAGCNTFRGKLTSVQGQKVKVSPLISTEMACAEITMKFEQLFLRTLESSDSYSYEKGFLTFADPKTKNFLRFERAAVSTVVLTFYINRNTIDCRGIVPMKCMQVKTKSGAKWETFYEGHCRLRLQTW